MGLIACPTCTTANNDMRTICRQCGTNLKGLKYGSAPTNGRGRISFQVDEARTVGRPSFMDVDTAYLIPVLFDGKEIGVNVALILYPEEAFTPATAHQLKSLEDTKAILTRVLSGRQRRKV